MFRVAAVIGDHSKVIAFDGLNEAFKSADRLILSAEDMEANATIIVGQIVDGKRVTILHEQKIVDGKRV